MSSSARPKTSAAAQPDSVRYRVRHSSAYRYGNDIMLAHHLLHLTPRPTDVQRVRGSRIEVEPKPSLISEHQDYFGNPITGEGLEVDVRSWRPE